MADEGGTAQGDVVDAEAVAGPDPEVRRLHADATPSIGLSRRHLRAQLVQEAAVLASRARAARRRGEVHSARVLQHRAEQVHDVVRSMDQE